MWTEESTALEHIDSSIHQIDCGVITSECSFFSRVTEQLGDTEAVNRMFVPHTLSSLGCPQVLQTMAPSELLEVNGGKVHVVTVRSWNDGKQDDEEITVQLPARLTQKGKVMAVNTLVVFYGVTTFVRDGVDMTGTTS